MNKEQIIIFNKYITTGIPVLVEDIPSETFNNPVILEAQESLNELNGHYEGTEFVKPKWLDELYEKTKTQYPILVINNLNKLTIEEQLKFVEILKYKQVSTFELPENSIIIVLCSNLSEQKLNEEIYSLLAHIKG